MSRLALWFRWFLFGEVLADGVHGGGALLFPRALVLEHLDQLYTYNSCRLEHSNNMVAHTLDPLTKRSAG